MRHRVGVDSLGILTVGELSAFSPGGGYFNKILGYNPVAYWPLWEASGTVAECLVNSAQNGTYARDVATMGTAAGIGDGNSAPVFDGTNDFININTAALVATINSGFSESTLFAWAKVDNWANGVWNSILTGTDDVNNRFQMNKSNVANRLYHFWVGGGTVEDYSDNGVADVGFICVAMVRSETADQVRYYRDGNLKATDNGVGVWASAGAWSMLTIGSSTLVPQQPWDGEIAHVAIFKTALDTTALSDLAVV